MENASQNAIIEGDRMHSDRNCEDTEQLRWNNKRQRLLRTPDIRRTMDIWCWHAEKSYRVIPVMR